jgi:preprotein translocase subunit SecF
MKLLKLVPDHTNIHFLKWRVPFYLVSMVLVAASWGLVLTKGSIWASISSAGR